MTPERLQEIKDWVNRKARIAREWKIKEGTAARIVRDLLAHTQDQSDYIDLILEDLRITRAERDAEKHKHLVTKQELHLHKTQMREARAIAWDTGAQAGLDWDKNYPGNIRDSNPFKESK